MHLAALLFLHGARFGEPVTLAGSKAESLARFLADLGSLEEVAPQDTTEANGAHVVWRLTPQGLAALNAASVD